MMDGIWNTIIFTLCYLVQGSVAGVLRLEPYGTSYDFFTGDNFFVTCSACDECRATRLVWQSPIGTDITNADGRIHVVPAPRNSMSLELVFQEVALDDAGTYVCSAVVDGTEVRAKFSLFVHQSITFSENETVQVGNEGDKGFLRCTVKSDPKATSFWYVGSEPLQNGSRHTMREDGLVIHKLVRSDTNNYTCRAFVVTEHNFQMKDFDIRFSVLYRPIWGDLHHERVFGLLDEIVQLVCEAHAMPNPSFEWFKEGTLLKNNFTFGIINDHGKSHLEVRILNRSVFGNYQCTAENFLGRLKRNIMLLEGAYPLQPLLSTYSNTPGTISIRMAPSVLDRLPLLGYRIEYRQKNDTWSNTTKEFYVHRGKTFVIHNLDFEKEYVVRIRTRNAMGYSDYSEEVSQFTKQEFNVTKEEEIATTSPRITNAGKAYHSSCQIVMTVFVTRYAFIRIGNG